MSKNPQESEFHPSFRRRPVERNSYDKKITIADLSQDQANALDDIYDLLKNQPPTVETLGGFAGTGKSTLIPLVSELLKDTSSTAFCAFTGKAANVLERKLEAAGIRHPGYVGTIHGLMYTPITNEHGTIESWQRKRDLYSDENQRPITRIIIDEASMVGRRLADDLLRYRLPIFAVGDHGQLPPVQDESIFDRPRVQLTKIHRHAEDNPILKLSQLVRENGDLPPLHQLPDAIRVVPNSDVMEVVGEAYERLGMDMAVLVRRNVIRKNFNILPRENPEPEIGDIVICLRNNPPIYNGMRGTLKAIEPYLLHWYKAEVFFPDDGLTVEGLINRYQFGREATIEHVSDLNKPNIRYPQSLPLGMLFDFGLAMTVHKSQGSAFQEVILCPERWSSDKGSDDYCKWLYTAVTRAVNKLTIVR